MISSELRPRSVAAREYLHQEGRVRRELFFIVAGVLRIVKQNERGLEVTHFFSKENQFCTILHSLTQEVPAAEGPAPARGARRGSR